MVIHIARMNELHRCEFGQIFDCFENHIITYVASFRNVRSVRDFKCNALSKRRMDNVVACAKLEKLKNGLLALSTLFAETVKFRLQRWRPSDWYSSGRCFLLGPLLDKLEN